MQTAVVSVSYRLVLAGLGFFCWLTVPQEAAATAPQPTPAVQTVYEAPTPLRFIFRYGSDEIFVGTETAPDHRPLEEVESLGADKWIAYDKLQHLTFSFLSTLSSQYILVEKFHWRHRYKPLGVSVGVTAALGLGKELYDHKHSGISSSRDLVADAMGILLASGLILL